jgi:hypothetical protein
MRLRLLLVVATACQPEASDVVAPTALERHFDEACSPFSMADDCLTLWPTVFHTTPDPSRATGRHLDDGPDSFVSPDGPLPVDPAMFNEADGVSPVSPLIVHLGRDVDRTQLWGPSETAQSMEAGAPVVLVDMTTGARVLLLTKMDLIRAVLARRDQRSRDRAPPCGHRAWALRNGRRLDRRPKGRQRHPAGTRRLACGGDRHRLARAVWRRPRLPSHGGCGRHLPHPAGHRSPRAVVRWPM